MEIPINNHLARENNLTTWHMWAMKATRVATFRDDYQRVRAGSYLTLVPSSTRKAHQVVRGVARTLSSVKRGKVSSNSATTKLLSFQGHYCPYASVHNSKLVAGGTTDVVLNWHRRGLPPSELRISCGPLSLLPIQYSPLFPSCPAQSHRRQQEPVANIIHIEPPSWEGAYREWLSTTRLLPVAYISRYSQSIVLIYCGGNKV
jgi:hypothetical protein